MKYQGEFNGVKFFLHDNERFLSEMENQENSSRAELNEINKANFPLKEKQKLNETQIFFLLYLKVITAALKLVTGQRRTDYGQVPIREYWKINGIAAPLQMVWMKILRAKSAFDGMIQGRVNGTDEHDFTRGLIDSLVDCINYAAFTIAECIMVYGSGENRLEKLYDFDDYEKTILDAIEKIKTGDM